MSESYKDIEIRSEEVQEILGHIPSRIIRYGIVSMFSIVFMIFLASFFFKYPDIITAEFEIVSQNPPAEIMARASGDLSQVYVVDSQKVSKNQLLGVIQNAANIEHIILLKSQLQTLEKQLKDPDFCCQLSDSLQLGDVQNNYYSLYKASKDYYQFRKQDYHKLKIEALKIKQVGLMEYAHLLEEQAQLKEEEYQLVLKQFQRDSLLFLKEVISSSNLEKSKMMLIQQSIAVRSAKSAVINTKLQVSDFTQQITELNQDYNIQLSAHIQNLNSLFNQLESQLASWFNQYALVSPTNGIVASHNIWSDNQYVSAGTQVFTILPCDKQEIVGRVTLKSKGAGKIKSGQKVNLKFNNYPYQEFGMVNAKVKSMSLVPINDEYILELEIPEKLVTNYGIELSFSQQMSGVAEIVTEDLPLIARLFNPIKEILKKHI